jgi:hypothetical protein
MTVMGIVLTSTNTCCATLPMEVSEVACLGSELGRLTVTTATLLTKGGVSASEKFL